MPGGHGSVSETSEGLAGSGSLIYNGAALGGATMYEVKTALHLDALGGSYVHYLRAMELAVSPGQTCSAAMIDPCHDGLVMRTVYREWVLVAYLDDFAYIATADTSGWSRTGAWVTPPAPSRSAPPCDPCDRSRSACR